MVDVLIVGSGGREHAFAWKLAQSPRIGKLFVAPGNGGTQNIAENVPIAADDTKELVRFAKDNRIGLTVVGPDNSLALGIVDAFKARGLRIFGPTKKAAEIESSKAFSKKLMREAGIPTAEFRVFRNHGDALSYVRKCGAPIVVKASGLALGKGAYICGTLAEAEYALEKIMLGKFHGSAGDEVVVEEFLSGQEMSVHAFCDGKTHVLLPPAQDHKPVGDGDEGENTGGMGAIVPLPRISAGDLRNIDERIVRPTLHALATRGRQFSGLLYPGLKMTKNGPKVLEFNARFGDPETQSYMRLLKTDLLDIMEACADGTLTDLAIEWHSGFAVCVIVASGGYPGKYEKNLPIGGVDEAENISDVVVFHAGTHIVDGTLRTSGGRVLGVSATGKTLREAINRAYQAVDCIRLENMHYRKDIGAKALRLEG